MPSKKVPNPNLYPSATRWFNIFMDFLLFGHKVCIQNLGTIHTWPQWHRIFYAVRRHFYVVKNGLHVTVHTWLQEKVTTRMHSSRMSTTRSSSCLLPGGVCLSACWDTHPQVWAWAPLGVGLDTPLPDPPARPLNIPHLGVGLETPLARPLNTPLGVGLETPPWTEWQTCAKILPCPKLPFTGGKNTSLSSNANGP